MLEEMKVGTRLGVGFGVVVLMLVLSSMLSFTKMTVIDDAIKMVLENRYPKTVTAHEIASSANVIGRAMNDLLLLKNPEQIKSTLARIAAERKLNNPRYESLDKSITSEKGRAILKNLAELRGAYRMSQDRLIELVQQGKREEAIDFQLSTVGNQQNDFLKAVDELVQYQGKLMEAAGDSAVAAYADARFWLMAILAVAVVVALGLGVVVTRSILRQLGGELTYALSAIGRIAAGDLTQQVVNTGAADSLLGAVGGMQVKLADVVRRVDGLSGALSTQAEAVACTSTQLGAASHHQAESTSQSAAAIEELTVSITEVSEVARHTESNSNQTVILAEEGNNLINDIAREIEAVAATVTESSEQIKTLE